MLRLIALSLIVAVPALAQTTKSKPRTTRPVATPAPAPQPVYVPAPPAPQPAVAPAPQKIKISYFAEFLGPALVGMDDRQPATTGDNQVGKVNNNSNEVNGDPIQLFNQFTISWAVTDTQNLQFQPRFTVMLGNTGYMADNGDKKFIVEEDHRVRLNSTYYKSDDKKLALTYNLGVRLPSSRASDNANVILQPDLSHVISYQITDALNFTLTDQLRYYWYEADTDGQEGNNKSPNERYRIYTNPVLTYVVSDMFEVWLQYEHILAHNKPEGSKSYFYLQDEQDAELGYVGANININPSFTFSPYLAAKQVRTFNEETLALGFYISAALY